MGWLTAGVLIRGGCVGYRTFVRRRVAVGSGGWREADELVAAVHVNTLTRNYGKSIDIVIFYEKFFSKAMESIFEATWDTGRRPIFPGQDCALCTQTHITDPGDGV